MHRYLLFMFLGIVTGCASSQFVDTSKLPDTYQCSYMKDICKEAREFESTYVRMSKEDQKEFETLLKTYRMQCNDALTECQKSSKQK